MSTFLDAIIPIVDVLETLQIPYYLGGSAASIAHGVPRTTMDVDMVIDLNLHKGRDICTTGAKCLLCSIG